MPASSSKKHATDASTNQVSQDVELLPDDEWKDIASLESPHTVKFQSTPREFYDSFMHLRGAWAKDVHN